jgi:protein-S-isoprenylcysteine O-methyltransferase Ste14
LEAWLQFKKARTAVCRTTDTSRACNRWRLSDLSQSHVSRHAAHFGGHCLFYGRSAIVFAPAAFYVVMDKAFIPYEEAKLKNGFGDHHTGYMKQTHRWL